MALRVSRRSAREVLGSAIARCEPLEQRRLLTTFINGAFTNPDGVSQSDNVYEFLEGSNAVRITITDPNNALEAEFIGYSMPDPGGVGDDVVLGDLTPAFVNNGGVIEPNQIDDTFTGLWGIYIRKADENVYISIAQTASDFDAESRPMEPTASGGSIRIRNASGNPVQTVALGNVGSVYLGARTTVNAPGDDIPIFFNASTAAFGIRPATNGVFAGIESAPNLDIGGILFGGTVTGRVILDGKIKLFYAGNILTGDARGLGNLETPGDTRDNFYVGNDIDVLAVAGGLGTVAAPANTARGDQALQRFNYKSGFDLEARGRVGTVISNTSAIGAFRVVNDAGLIGLTGPQRELEQVELSTRFITPTSNTLFEAGGIGGAGFLGGDDLPSPGETDSFFRNDTFETAQIVGGSFKANLNGVGVEMRGFLSSSSADNFVNDQLDFYAMGLLAGQTVTVELDTLIPNFPGPGVTNLKPNLPVAIGVFNPDGQLVYTDYDNVSAIRVGGNVESLPFTFTADRPGLWRFCVAARGDSDFDGQLSADPRRLEDGFGTPINTPYVLKITGSATDIAFGGIQVADHLITRNLDPITFPLDPRDKAQTIDVLRGDLGGIQAGGVIFSATGTEFVGIVPVPVPVPYTVKAGNLRAMVADSIGLASGLGAGGQAAGALLGFGPDLLTSGHVGLLRTDNPNADSNVLQINVGSQQTDAQAGTFDSTLAIGGSYQLIDAANTFAGNIIAKQGVGAIRAFAVNTTSFVGVWAVNTDNAGSDGVIDLIDVQTNFGTAASGGPAIFTFDRGNVRYLRAGGTTFRDQFFGTTNPDLTIFPPGEEVNLTDDSGANMTLSPIPLNLVFDPTRPTQPPTLQNPGRLTVLTYPVRDKGGVIVVDVQSTRGFEIETSGRGTVEIGRIALTIDPSNPFSTPGRPLTVINNADGTLTFRQAVSTLDRNISMKGSAMVDVFEINTLGDANAPMGVTELRNRTLGEIINIDGGDYFRIDVETLGLSRAGISGYAPQGRVRVRPFASTLPFVNPRNLINVRNLADVRSRRGLGNINSENIGTLTPNSDGKGVSKVFEGINAPIFTNGAMDLINIGEGLLPSGSGIVPLSGLYSRGLINRVRGTALYSDVRGNVVSSTGVNSITLTNGAIINSDVMVLAEQQDGPFFEQSLESYRRGFSLTGAIGTVQLTGVGGIIGSNFRAGGAIDSVLVNGGFGVITSAFVLAGLGTVNQIIADGYGIRETLINAGTTLNTLQARGNGKLQDTRFFTGSVRSLESKGYATLEPFTGIQVNPLNDLHTYLGTTANTPKVKGKSEAGVIEDVIATSQRTIGRIDAQRIIGRDVVSFPFSKVTTARSIATTSNDYPMRFSAGNRIQRITVRDYTENLVINTGDLTMDVKGDMLANAVSVAGTIRRLSAGALRGNTTVRATGPNGSITELRTRRSLYATVNVSQNIGTLSVGTDIGSPNFKVGGNVTTFQVAGSLLTGANVEVSRTINLLSIGGDIKAGATLKAKAINNQSVAGGIFGNLIITG